ARPARRAPLGLAAAPGPRSGPPRGRVPVGVFSGGPAPPRRPVRRPRPEAAALAPFGPAEGSGPYELDVLRSPTYAWTTSQRVVTTGSTIGAPRRADGQKEPSPAVGRTRHEAVVVQDVGAARHPATGIEYDCTSVTTYTIDDDAPLLAQIRCDWKIGISRGAWRTRIETASLMTADARDFRVTNVMDAYEDETRIFSKTCTDVVPRDLI